MLIKYIIDEDFVNYKKTCMTIGFPFCNFKCGKELCQNSPIVKMKNIEISYEAIVKRYLNNNITSAIVMQGMEPFDSWIDLYNLIKEFRKYIDDDIIIFTGFDADEIFEYTQQLAKDYKNIIIKYGRYLRDQTPHYDEVLGVNLASDNQYAERIC